METTYTNIEDLKLKVNNAEAAQEIEDAKIQGDVTDDQVLTAAEWNTLVGAVQQLQECDAQSVKSVKVNGTTYSPDADGQVSFVTTETDFLSMTISTDDSSYSMEGGSILLADKNFKVKVKVSYKYHPAGEEAYNLKESVNVTVQTGSLSDNGISYTTAVTLQSAVTANDSSWAELDISQYMTNGVNYIRLIANGVIPHTIGGTDMFGSASIAKSYNVVNLNLVSNTYVGSPLEITTSGDDKVRGFNYLITGNVSKYIQFDFGHRDATTGELTLDWTHGTESTTPSLCRNIGTDTEASTGRTYTFIDGIGEDRYANIFASGRHIIRARLYVSELLKTEWVETEYMVGTANSVIVNNVNTHVDNWSDVTFFTWSSYTSSGTLPVVFRLTDANDTTTYATWNYDVANGEHTFTTQLGLELDSTVTTINAYMHIEDGSGNTLSSPVLFIISNSADFAPVSGATFILQPATRSNDEENPQTIINVAASPSASQSERVPDSTWENFDMVNDGYIEVNKDILDTSPSAEKVHALRVPAGRRLTIDYNFLRRLATAQQGQYATFEIDCRASNITDETKPIISLCTISQSDSEIWGFQMLPTEACLLTANQRVRDNQNVTWAEDMRTRITVNIVRLNPDNNPSGTYLNYVRLFVNDVMDCEFLYDFGDNFYNANGDVKLVIGSTDADVDIFGMRYYETSLSTSDVMQDYRAGLSTTAEKVAQRNANSIYVDGKISYSEAITKYNCIVHTGNPTASTRTPNLPKYGYGKDYKTNNLVNLLIRIQGDDEHSGELRYLENKGQGTTAMGYYYWNQQYKIQKDDASKGIVASKWVPWGSSEEQSAKSYAIADGEAGAKKLVGKINFASSMQSHKLGLTWAYTDLFKQIIGTTTSNSSDGMSFTLTRPSQMTLQPNARIAVYEKPFLFFYRDTANDEPQFMGLMTFGAGKGDKPTFGYDDETTPHMLMVEGADNDAPLACFTIPWDNAVTYDAANEYWKYGAGDGVKNLNFGFGHVDANDAPDDADAISSMKNFFNFAYLHSMNITFFEGTLAQLKSSSTTDRSKQYWLTSNYLTYRYDAATSDWVSTGINKADLNIKTQFVDFYNNVNGTSIVEPNWSGLGFAAITTQIINMRVAHFRKNAETYFHVCDALYHSCFVKFFAGTDNRAKNTYYYTDPTTLKVRWMQDDLDTMIKTNNVGQNRKPYYVEEHDTDSDGEYYWQGENNVFYNLLEKAFDSEMTQIMRTMMQAMVALGGSANGFMQKYLLSTQDYFPAIAYNETARVVYEHAQTAQTDGTYQNQTPAITQSKGSQRWSEYQWLLDRTMYISSWCEFGEFGSGQVSGSLGVTGASGAYSFTLTPAKWLYPRIGRGDGNMSPSVNGRVRVPAGETFTYLSFSNESDSRISVKGINYYFKIGDFNIPAKSGDTFTLAGRKLQEFTVNPSGENTVRFNVGSITISNATNIKKFIVRGATNLTSTVNLSSCVRLTEVDISGCTANAILPQTGSLTTVHLPAVSSLTLINLPNLSTLTLDGYDNLSTINIDDSSIGISTVGLISAFKNNNVNLGNVTLTNVNWTNTSDTIVDYLASAPISNVYGIIRLASNIFISFNQKMNYVERWGDIDDTTTPNPLVITYTAQALTSFQIGGKNYLTSIGNHQYDIVTSSEGTGNDVVSITWGYAATETEGVPDYNISDYINGITQKGVVNVKNLSEDKDFIVSCTMVKKDGTSIVRTYTVGLYAHPRTIGDYVFSDGSWSDRLNPSKTIIGKCFMLIDEEHGLCRQSGSGKTRLFWGLINANHGVPNVTLQDPNDDMSAYDTPLINTNVAKDETFITLEEDIFDVGVGSTVTQSMYNNLVVLKHRNRIMNDSGVGLTDYIPEVYFATQRSYGRNITMLQAYEECETALYDLAVSLGKSGNAAQGYRQFLFPMFTYCHCYEPTVKDGEILADHLRAGKWFLPLATVYKEMNTNKTLWKDSNYTMPSYNLASCEEIAPGYAVVFYPSNGNIRTSADSGTGVGVAWSNMPVTGNNNTIAVAVCVF